MKTVWGNTIVKNEGRFIYFAIMSVIDFLDKILVWDSGSTDSTVEIIKKIKKKKGKIEFKEIGNLDKDSFTAARQKMLEQTKSDWIFLLDGDEVWWDKSIKKITEIIKKKGDDFDLIVNPYLSVIGDIYHYQEEAAGKYNIGGKTGHLNIRAINRKIPGLYVDKPYGLEGFFDNGGKRIQDRDRKRILYLNQPYLHFSNIKRSNAPAGDQKVMQRSRKIRHEIGNKFPKDFIYPEVLYIEAPSIVPSPWSKMSNLYKVRAFVETPFRKLKRRIF